MKNIISTIKKLVSEDVVNESFLNYLDLYIIKNDKKVHSQKVTNRFHSQLQVNFAFDELSKHYSAIISKEVKQITQEIVAKERDSKEDFKDFLHVNYKELMSMLIEKKPIKPAPFHFEDPEYNSKYIIHVMQLISFHVQDKFVIPLLNFIEKNYIVFLMDDCVFPLPVDKLIKVIDSHNLVFETLNTDEAKPDNFCAEYSDRDNCFYYLSYNMFVDLSSYNIYLNKIVSEFEEYINSTTQNIEGAYEKINLLNQIRLKIKSSILLFSKLPKSNNAVKKSLPQYARSDTYAIYNQLIIESFHQSKDVQFSPSLIDFQDLQHSIAKGAHVFIKTKLWILEESMELKNDEPKTVSGTDPQNIFHDKIKTNLTVPQIAALFKGLIEEKDILDVKNKTDLYRSIAACFTSKRREEFKAGTVRKNFNQPDEQTIEFLIEKLTHLLQYFKNLRNNSRG